MTTCADQSLARTALCAKTALRRVWCNRPRSPSSPFPPAGSQPSLRTPPSSLSPSGEGRRQPRSRGQYWGQIRRQLRSRPTLRSQVTFPVGWPLGLLSKRDSERLANSEWKWGKRGDSRMRAGVKRGKERPITHNSENVLGFGPAGAGRKYVVDLRQRCDRNDTCCTRRAQ